MPTLLEILCDMTPKNCLFGRTCAILLCIEPIFGLHTAHFQSCWPHKSKNLCCIPLVSVLTNILWCMQHKFELWSNMWKSPKAQDWVLGHITERCAAQNWTIQPYFEPWQYESERQAAQIFRFLEASATKNGRYAAQNRLYIQHKGEHWAVLKMASKQHWNKCPDNQNCSIIHWSTHLLTALFWAKEMIL